VDSISIAEAIVSVDGVAVEPIAESVSVPDPETVVPDKEVPLGPVTVALKEQVSVPLPLLDTLVEKL